MIHFINYQTMAQVILAQRAMLPSSPDLVVGIPRSGLVPAAMMAAQLNLPMVDVDGLLENRTFEYGKTKSAPDIARAMGPDRTVLIVDDVVGSGRAFREVKERIASKGLPGRFIYCSIFGVMRKHPDVDVILKTLPGNLLFQWNLLHHRILAEACVDIDGVICSNPMAHECVEGRAYLNFVKNGLLLQRTSGTIGWLVTSRLEKHRDETEKWLSRHGVSYRHLIMASEEDKQDSPAYKARVYRNCNATLFIESEAYDAGRIAAESGKPVIAIETMSLVQPDGAKSALPPRRDRNVRWNSRVSNLKLSVRRMVGPTVYYAAKAVYTSLRRPAN